MPRLFAIMGLAVKCGEEITIICEGSDVEAAFDAMKNVLKEL